MFGELMGAIGLISGIGQNNKANRLQGQALDIQKDQLEYQKKVTDRALGFFDMIGDWVKTHEKGGYFDADRRLADVESDFIRTRDESMGNLGAAFKTMGYRPGDTAPQDTFATAERQRQSDLDRLRLDIESSAFQDYINANIAAAGGTPMQGAAGYSGAAGQASGFMFNQANATRPNMAGLFQMIQPFLAGNVFGGSNPQPAVIGGSDASNWGAGQGVVGRV